MLIISALARVLALSLALAGAAHGQRQQQQQQHAHQQLRAYNHGEDAPIECRDEAGGWTAAPICRETGRPLGFSFGTEQFFSCTIDITPPIFAFFERVVNGDATYSCRVGVFRDRPADNNPTAFLPFILPLWGFSQAAQGSSNLVVNTHMNFIFHIDNGAIMGAAAYPVRDQFVMINQNGGVLTLHGPSKFFDRGSFVSISASGTGAYAKHRAAATQAPPRAAVDAPTQPPEAGKKASQATEAPAAPLMDRIVGALRGLIRGDRRATVKPSSAVRVGEGAGGTAASGETALRPLYVLVFLVVAVLAAIAAVVMYHRVLKPRLVDEHLKKE